MMSPKTSPKTSPMNGSSLYPLKNQQIKQVDHRKNRSTGLIFTQKSRNS
jgi:hypothetical protein